MKSLRIKPLLSIAIIILLLAFALPQFSVQVGNYEITWPEIDLSVIGVDSRLGNFTRGNGLYPDTLLVYTADLTSITPERQADIFARDTQIIKSRMVNTSLQDIELYSEQVNNRFQLVFTFPNNYTEATAREIADILVSRGVVDIWEHSDDGAQEGLDTGLLSFIYDQSEGNGYNPVVSTLKYSDISSAWVEARVNYNGPVLRLRFKPSVQAVVEQVILDSNLLTSNPKPPVLVFDGIAEMFIIDPVAIANANIVSTSTIEPEQNLDLLASPILGEDNFTKMQIYAGLINALQAGEGVLNGSYSHNITQVGNVVYAPEGRTVVAVMFVIIGVLVFLSVIIRHSWYKAWALSISVFGYGILSVGLLKLISADISISMLIAFTLGLLLAYVIVWSALDDEKVVGVVLRHTRIMSAYLFILTGLLFNMNIGWGAIHSLFGNLAVLSVSLMISSWIFFSPFIMQYHNRLMPKHG